MEDFIIIPKLLTDEECDMYLNKAKNDPILEKEMDLGDLKFSRVNWKNRELSEKLLKMALNTLCVVI